MYETLKGLSDVRNVCLYFTTKYCVWSRGRLTAELIQFRMNGVLKAKECLTFDQYSSKTMAIFK